MPVTDSEKKTWNFVSFTAGVTEEIIYRGFLILALGTLFPGWSIWTVIIISAIMFGLAHIYQGLGGAVRTTVVGVLFALIYVSIGSLIPLILFHIFIDWIAKKEPAFDDKQKEQTRILLFVPIQWWKDSNNE